LIKRKNLLGYNFRTAVQFALENIEEMAIQSAKIGFLRETKCGDTKWPSSL